MLSDIGFPWKTDLKQERQQNWQQLFDALANFQKQFGHMRVPKGWKDSPSLGTWMTRQRRHKSLLTPEQHAQLERIGFDWAEDIKKGKQQKWLSLYRELKAYRENHGHTRVPNKDHSQYTLSRWVSWQRKRKAENKLSPRPIQLLNQIGFAGNGCICG